MWCELFIQSSPMSNLPSPPISYPLQKTTPAARLDIPHPASLMTIFCLPLHGLLKIPKRPNDLCETKSAGLVIELQTLPAINPSVDLPRFAFIILIRHKAQTITRNAQPQHRWIERLTCWPQMPQWIVMIHLVPTNANTIILYLYLYLYIYIYIYIYIHIYSQRPQALPTSFFNGI